MNENPREVIDPSFKDLTFANVTLERISKGHMWTEGPVWFGDQQCLLFSDIPKNKIFRWTPDGSVSVFRDQSNFANGNTRDRAGRLITCEHGSRRVTRTELNGRLTILASMDGDKRLNSPNDVVVKSDGSIWFTDPSYGIMGNLEGNKSEPDLDGRYVYHIDPQAKTLTRVCDQFSQPNGLAFSADEKTLYIAESGSSHDDQVPTVIRAYDVEGTALTHKSDLITVSPGLPDGFRVDAYDNIWTSAADGVHCYASDGTLLGKINVPETVANLTFGGTRHNQLFITATTSVYMTYVNTTSAINEV